MKRKFTIFVFIFIFSFLAFGFDVNAQSYMYNWNGTYSEATRTVKNFLNTTGVEVKASNSSTDYQVVSFNNTDWKFNTQAVKLNMSGYMIFQRSYTNKLYCSNTYIDAEGVSWCTNYDYFVNVGYSIRPVVTFTNGSRTFCNMNNQSDSGAFNIECIIPDGTTGISNVRFEFWNSYLPDSETNNFYIGLSHDMIWEISDSSILNNIDTSINNTSQNQIDTMNKNQEQANNNSQNQINATNKTTEATKEQIEQDRINQQQTIQNFHNMQDKQDTTNKNLDTMNDNITSSDVDVDDSFFSGFDNNTHGLTSIITAPLQLIGSITSSTCTPLGIPMPFGMPSVTLPCMGSIYHEYFGDFFKLYQTITFGMVSYWVCVQIFAMVKGFKDPDSDKVEVLDL